MKDQSNYTEQLNHHRNYYNSGATLPVAFRIAMLQKLKKSIISNESLIAEALNKDLGKSRHEVITTETGQAINEINYLIKALPKLTRKKRVSTNTINLPGKSYSIPEPYGVTLIIGPWNYPFQLVMAPLAGAIAGGNCAVVKPSEIAAHTSAVIEKILSEIFEDSYISIVTGGIPETTALLDQSFDKIFFTGSPKVGSIVMEKAAKHLTPVVLELGGKSPAIIDQTAKLDLALRRIIFGKASNAGQTCVAPDYLLVHHSVTNKVEALFSSVAEDFYSHNYENNNDFGRIINERNFDRLVEYLKDGQILYGGNTNRTTRHIDLTLLKVDDLNTPVMQEEIFGPILPLVTYTTLEEAIAIIKKNPNPLAMYIFSQDKATINTLLSKVPFGGGCINDTLLHLTNEHLPFGGRGTSGMGRYHGKYSFETFTHEKAILQSSTFFDLKMKYPPYTEKKLPIIRKLLYGNES